MLILKIKQELEKKFLTFPKFLRFLVYILIIKKLIWVKVQEVPKVPGLYFENKQSIWAKVPEVPKVVNDLVVDF